MDNSNAVMRLIKLIEANPDHWDDGLQDPDVQAALEYCKTRKPNNDEVVSRMQARRLASLED